MARIAASVHARLATARALYNVLSSVEGASESALVERWRSKISEIDFLMNEGWYAPPPSGFSVLISAPPNYTRGTYDSLRDEGSWPRTDLRYGESKVLFAYASPLTSESCMIGDIAVSLYSGNDSAVRSHLAACFDIAARIAAFVELGMSFAEIYAFGAEQIIKAYGSRDSLSLRNYLGISDVGHTVPWSYDDPTPSDRAIIGSGDMSQIAGLVSRKRVFVSASADLYVQPNMAFSIEPRIPAESLPIACFHVLVCLIGGVKSIVTGFGPLIDLFGMAEFLPLEATGVLCSDVPLDVTSD